MAPILKKLPRETVGDLFLLILDFVNGIEEPVDNLLLEVAFEPIKAQLIRDRDKWDKIKLSRSEAGKKGMESRWQKESITNDNTVIDDITNITVSDNVNDTVSVNVNDNVINKEKNPLSNNIPIKEKTHSSKKEKVVKVAFEQSEIFDKKSFRQIFSEWPKSKCIHYYNSAISYSAEGNRYVKWDLAIANWARRDDLEGRYTWPADSVTQNNNQIKGLAL